MAGSSALSPRPTRLEITTVEKPLDCLKEQSPTICVLQIRRQAPWLLMTSRMLRRTTQEGGAPAQVTLASKRFEQDCPDRHDLYISSHSERHRSGASGGRSETSTSGAESLSGQEHAVSVGCPARRGAARGNGRARGHGLSLVTRPPNIAVRNERVEQTFHPVRV